IEQTSGATVLVGEGTLYPALHRLERARLVKSEWGLSENNRQARFYTLSPAGRTRLRTGTASWMRFVERASHALTSSNPVPA
ncbi:MAG: helix-turn-helix transcriptional regulator, partial [Gemmatimonadaceae bacterium]